MLTLSGVDVFYDDMQVLWGVDLAVASGEVVALLGSNGAGKSTVMGTISGLVRVGGGTVRLDGRDITTATPRERIELGIAHVLERHRLFPFMTARENLLLGAYIPRARARTQESLDWVLGLFPFLRTRLGQHAGGFSGGEQQLLAIARGLMSRPRLLMLDEPSMGLAPLLVEQVFHHIGELFRAQGLSVLLIEQRATEALEASQRSCVLEGGRIVISGPSSLLLNDPAVRNSYLGVAAQG